MICIDILCIVIIPFVNTLDYAADDETKLLISLHQHILIHADEEKSMENKLYNKQMLYGVNT